jgi:hypothetical protein
MTPAGGLVPAGQPLLFPLFLLFPLLFLLLALLPFQFG